MGMTIRNVMFVVGVTLITQFAANQAVAMFPMARRLIRGSVVSVVPSSRTIEV